MGANIRAHEPEAQLQRDPVCGAKLLRKYAIHVSQYNGRTYYFCCSGCKRSFDHDPSMILVGYRSGNNASPQRDGLARNDAAALTA